MQQGREYIVGLGGNVGDTERILDWALTELESKFGPLTVSNRITTSPWGYASENSFQNQVVVFTSTAPPEKVLDLLQAMELQAGRHRTVGQSGYQDRPLDLDIVAVGESVFRSSRLGIPHPLMHLREFVLVPFTEVRPEWVHPLLGKTCQELLVNLGENPDCRGEN